MKFPITREALQAFDFDKDREEVAEVAEEAMIERICKDLKQNMRSETCRVTKKFVWKNLQHYDIRNLDKYIPQLINKLKEIFIGCDIITDPLKTYLIIDWS